MGFQRGWHYMVNNSELSFFVSFNDITVSLSGSSVCVATLPKRLSFVYFYVAVYLVLDFNNATILMQCGVASNRITVL